MVKISHIRYFLKSPKLEVHLPKNREKDYRNPAVKRCKRLLLGKKQK